MNKKCIFIKIIVDIHLCLKIMEPKLCTFSLIFKFFSTFSIFYSTLWNVNSKTWENAFFQLFRNFILSNSVVFSIPEFFLFKCSIFSLIFKFFRNVFNFSFKLGKIQLWYLRKLLSVLFKRFESLKLILFFKVFLVSQWFQVFLF